MLPNALLYNLSQNIALNEFKTVSKHDLMILLVLYCSNKPMSYLGLYYVIEAYGFAASYQTYTNSLKHCISMEYVNRQPIGNNVTYSITYSGRALVNNINSRLDQCVKEQIIKYGNGFTE